MAEHEPLTVKQRNAHLEWPTDVVESKQGYEFVFSNVIVKSRRRFPPSLYAAAAQMNFLKAIYGQAGL